MVATALSDGMGNISKMGN